MSNGLKGLTLAAGVIITCLVISIGFFIAKEAKDIAYQGVEQMGGYVEEMANSELEFYNGLTVSGSEVEKTVKRLYQDTGIWVYQKNGSAAFVDDQITDVAAFVQALELNPHGSFLGDIEYDEKGKIKWMTFTQE